MPSSELSMVFCYVYVLYSPSNKTFYVGYTFDLKKRFTEHNRGLSFSTKPYSPWQLIYYEAHTNEDDARRREKYLKTTAGGRAIQRILSEKLIDLRNLSNRKSTTRYA